MIKKFALPILIFAILIQIAIPVVMISYGQQAEADLLKYGKEFKIKVYVQHIYEGSIDYKFYDYYNWYNLGFYATIEEDSDGYANLFADVNKSKPETDYYICVTRENKMKLADFSIDSDYTSWRVDEESAYLVIRVYKGNFEVIDLYMDGIPAEEWVTTEISAEEQDVLFDDEEIIWEEENLFENT